jgi:hypothetical protein
LRTMGTWHGLFERASTHNRKLHSRVTSLHIGNNY